MKSSPFLLSLILLSGCKVGPDYSPPITPMPLAYAEDRPNKTATILDEDFFEWWTLFNDPFLDYLLEEALWGSFDYRIAVEKIYQARAQFWVQATELLPELDGDFQASRFRTSQSFANRNTNTTTTNVANASCAGASALATPTVSAVRISPIQNFFQTGLDAVWQIDLFGQLRRSADASYDLWEASAEDARAVKIVVLSEVANIYAAICAAQKKASTIQQIVNLDKSLFDFSNERFRSGLADEQETQTALAALRADEVNLLTAQTVLKLNIYSLGTLLGKDPESIIDDFKEIHPIPYASDRVPAGLPSDLLRRRPDIASAERNLAAATEQIGVAVAELFPKISLTGSSSSFASNPLQGANIGFSSDQANKLFKKDSLVWGIGALVTFPVFDFGKRMAGVDVQRSLQHQAYLTYQKTVITALQEVEQALVSYFNEEKRVQLLIQDAQAYERILDLVSDQFRAGLANFTQVMQARANWLYSVNTLIDSQEALAQDLIAIYKAMGGDW